MPARPFFGSRPCGGGGGMSGEHPSGPARRGFLGCLAVAATGGAVIAHAASGPSPDAALIALCSRFDELERMSQQFLNSGDNDHLTDAQAATVTTPWHDEQAELLPRILALPAATMAGFVARAKMAVLWAPDLLENPYEGWHMEMAGALMRDLLATQGRAPA
jgi:hypothetical protein